MMIIRKFTSSTLLTLVVLSAAVADVPCRAGPIQAKVLFAGEPGSPRSKDFVEFLKEHFSVVGEANFLTLREEETSGYDVLVLDWPGLPPRDKSTGKFLGPSLPNRFSLPTVLIGPGPLSVARSFRLKIDDLCVCLGDSAHGIDTSHEVFGKPFRIDIRLEVRPTPASYFNWPTRSAFGKTLRVWKVQDGGWSVDRPEDLSTLPGIVSDPYGFTDSPDAEVISGGINSKCYDAVAIGRHGNFLLWGFQAAPAKLLPEARRCLVNCICYIRKFTGRPPIVRKVAPFTAREWAVVYAYSYKINSDRDAFLATLPKSLRDDPVKAEDLFRTRRESSLKLFPATLRDRIGREPEAYIAYYRDNLEFLRYTGEKPFPFVLDEDVKRIATSNRTPEFLSRCIDLLERGGNTEVPLRLLRLYTAETFDEPAQWRKWLSENRGHLYFTDVGAYKFRGSPLPLRPSITAVGPDDEGRRGAIAQGAVSARVEMSPKTIRAGEEATLSVHVDVVPNWFIHVLSESDGPQNATRLTLALPSGVEGRGSWKSPEPHTSADGGHSYIGPAVFKHRIRVVPDRIPGHLRGACTIRYQACDPFRCLLPQEEKLSFEIDVVPASGGPMD